MLGFESPALAAAETAQSAAIRRTRGDRFTLIQPRQRSNFGHFLREVSPRSRPCPVPQPSRPLGVLGDQDGMSDLLRGQAEWVAVFRSPCYWRGHETFHSLPLGGDPARRAVTHHGFVCADGQERPPSSPRDSSDVLPLDRPSATLSLSVLCPTATTAAHATPVPAAPSSQASLARRAPVRHRQHAA